MDFDLLISCMCTISTFEAQLPVKKRSKSENSKWPPEPEVVQKWKQNSLYIALNLLNTNITLFSSFIAKLPVKCWLIFKRPKWPPKPEVI